MQGFSEKWFRDFEWKKNYDSVPPRAGRTLKLSDAPSSGPNFNPPSPHGEGPGRALGIPEDKQFQSTLPVWGGTGPSTAPRGRPSDFNPPSPCGEGPGRERFRSCVHNFNPPSPHGEGRQGGQYPPGSTHFNPPSPHGEGLGGLL